MTQTHHISKEEGWQNILMAHWNRSLFLEGFYKLIYQDDLLARYLKNNFNNARTGYLPMSEKSPKNVQNVWEFYQINRFISKAKKIWKNECTKMIYSNISISQKNIHMCSQKMFTISSRRSLPLAQQCSRAIQRSFLHIS